MKLTEVQKYFESSLYEMSNFGSDTTGLPSGTNLWIRTEPKGLPHAKYRIKLDHPQLGFAIFALWGDEPKRIDGDWVVSGKELKQIETLIKATHNELRDHIDGNIDSGQLGVVLQKTKPQVEQI